MKKMTVGLAVAVIVCGCFSPCVSARPLKVGIVRIGAVFEKYAKRTDLDKRRRAERQKRLDILREKEKEVRRLTDEVKLFDLGIAGRRKAEDKLEQKGIELETYRKHIAKAGVRQYMEYTKELYDEIRAAVDRYAKRAGYDLVLKVGEREVNADSINMLMLKMEISTVLYHSEALDITDQIIKILNVGYGKDIEEK